MKLHGNAIDLTGQRFGKWTILSPAGQRDRRMDWLCRCDCGVERRVYSRLLREGKSRSCGCIVEIDRSAEPPPKISGATWVPLGRGNFTLIDDADIALVGNRKWTLQCQPHGPSYARGGVGGFPMHRLIVGLEAGDPREVDHINGNGLDNRRSNLRICTTRDNAGNRRGYSRASPYKGVDKSQWGVTWQARIGRNGRVDYLGCFNTPEEAARAYDSAAREYFGAFARLNFPEEHPN